MVAQSNIFHSCFRNDAETFLMWLAAFWTKPRQKKEKKKSHRNQASISAHEDLLGLHPDGQMSQEAQGPAINCPWPLFTQPPQEHLPTAALGVDSNPSLLWLEGWCFLARDHKAILHSKLNKQVFESVFYWFHTICHLAWGEQGKLWFCWFCVCVLLLLGFGGFFFFFSL